MFRGARPKLRRHGLLSVLKNITSIGGSCRSSRGLTVLRPETISATLPSLHHRRDAGRASHTHVTASCPLCIAVAKKGATRGVVATAGFWTPNTIPTLLVSLSCAEVQCIAYRGNKHPTEVNIPSTGINKRPTSAKNETSRIGVGKRRRNNRIWPRNRFFVPRFGLSLTSTGSAYVADRDFAGAHATARCVRPVNARASRAVRYLRSHRRQRRARHALRRSRRPLTIARSRLFRRMTPTG